MATIMVFLGLSIAAFAIYSIFNKKDDRENNDWMLDDCGY